LARDRVIEMEMAVAAKQCLSTGAMPALLIALALITLVAGGCGEDNPLSGHTASPYLSQSLPANVVSNLVTAYQRQDIAGYTALLADDYQFYFDEDTRTTHHLPVFWTRLDDSIAVCGLFNDPDITGIRVELQHGLPYWGLEVGREQWMHVDVSGGFVEIDCSPTPAHPQGQTRRFEVGLQHLSLRRGRTVADTDTTTSETARAWYIVEWDVMSGIWPGHPDSLRCRQ
jgi:hypothetical protein